MTRRHVHPGVGHLHEALEAGKIGRRQFLRDSTLLGLSAAAAYGAIGGLDPWARPAHAADMPKGGILRFGSRVKDITNPHASNFNDATEICRPVCEYLTRTGEDNVTRPWLVAAWEVTDDLKTWTFRLRDDVTWHSGEKLVTDHVLWNIRRVIDPTVGSSMLGLMGSYLNVDIDTGEVDADGKAIMRTEVWDANAIEKIDDYNFRLNLRVPQLAVPEHMFHYPFNILHPKDNGVFGVGADGHGPFKLVEYTIGDRAILEASTTWWGDFGPFVDRVEFIDLGDDNSALSGAMASSQVDGLYTIDETEAPVYEAMPHVVVYRKATAQTGVARFRMDTKPFDDARVRLALKLSQDVDKVMEVAIRGNGSPGENHHVSPIHPEYAPLPKMERDVPRAKALLAEAGYPDGISFEISCVSQPPWELAAVLVLKNSWAEAGIEASVNVMPGATYWDVWDKVPVGFTAWGQRPLGIMVLGLAYRTGAPWNESGYSNAELDALLEVAEGTVDVEARRAIMEKIEIIMQQDGPICQPAWTAIVTAFNERVLGFDLQPQKFFFFEKYAIAT